MTSHLVPARLLALPDHDLAALARTLAAGRLRPPFGSLSLQGVVSPEYVVGASADLQALAGAGFAPAQIGILIESLVADRRSRSPTDALIDLVTTGPEAPGVNNRDTAVVVRELFAHAEQSVLLVGYAVYQGQKVFRALADRMVERPGLEVRLFLDIKRGPGDTSTAEQLVRRFAHDFRTKMWPADRPLPAVFYDPRSLSLDKYERTALHAKCVVIDRQVVFVSSANFTEAAQERNIEVGLLSRSATLAVRVAEHFDRLLVARLLLPVDHVSLA
jgi:phosphatidylserine/phosphatidylglycerophosphate/cardiolipin synthase-like enzyme